MSWEQFPCGAQPQRGAWCTSYEVLGKSHIKGIVSWSQWQLQLTRRLPEALDQTFKKHSEWEYTIPQWVPRLQKAQVFVAVRSSTALQWLVMLSKASLSGSIAFHREQDCTRSSPCQPIHQELSPSSLRTFSPNRRPLDVLELNSCTQPFLQTHQKSWHTSTRQSLKFNQINFFTVHILSWGWLWLGSNFPFSGVAKSFHYFPCYSLLLLLVPFHKVFLSQRQRQLHRLFWSCDMGNATTIPGIHLTSVWRFPC